MNSQNSQKIMPGTKIKENRELISIKFGTDHYLANLLACTKILGIHLKEARSLCKQKPDIAVKLSPPLNIVSKYTTDEILQELEEYEITVSIKTLCNIK